MPRLNEVGILQPSTIQDGLPQKACCRNWPVRHVKVYLQVPGNLASHTGSTRCSWHSLVDSVETKEWVLKILEYSKVGLSEGCRVPQASLLMDSRANHS